MRVIDVAQRSEQWDRLRARPTASQFYRFCTPAKGAYASQATVYAAEIVAKRLGVYTESPPSYWMERGTEMEPHAKASYTAETGREIVDVGFLVPDHTEAYGGSPDGLVDGGLIEIKCPKPEKVIQYHAEGTMPDEYKPQVQGLLWISGLPWCDFYGWHEGLTPFLYRVEADPKYHEKLEACMAKLLDEIERIEKAMEVKW